MGYELSLTFVAHIFIVVERSGGRSDVLEGSLFVGREVGWLGGSTWRQGNRRSRKFHARLSHAFSIANRGQICTKEFKYNFCAIISLSLDLAMRV